MSDWVTSMMPVGHPDRVPGTREHAARITEGRHQGVQSALQWLAFSHLPDELRTYSEPMYMAAVEMIRAIMSDTPELTTALNKLVEAKDWAVRAGIRDKYGRPGPVSRPDAVVNPPTFEEDPQ